MTDRSVQVTIGAVLTSTFRTSFREARAEVTGLSRSLDTLGGRRSNAGLFSVRDASTAARTSLRGLRTEISATTRALDTLPARAARAGTVFRSLATEARAAAAGVQSLNSAMRGLASGSSTTALGRMNTATRTSAMGTRQLRTEAGALGRSLVSLDRRLNSTTTALGRYSVAARTASSAAGGLTRSTGNTGNTFATAAQHIHGATSATTQMTGAINAQIAAQNRLNAATRAMPRGGAGGGGGHGAGGGGSHMPLGAHAGLHTAFGAVGGGILAGKLVHGVWENASDYAHQIAMRKVQGWNQEEIAQLKRQATDISAMVGNIADRDILKTAGHLQLAFGDREEALRHLQALTQSTSLLKWATPDVNGEENSYGMVKALEQMGRAKDPANFDRLVESFTAATIASGGKFNGQQLFQMVGRSGTAAANLSDDFLTKYMPSIIQELGGSQAGNTLAMVRSALIGGRMTRGAAQTWDSLGLLDHTQSDPTMTTPGSTGHGNIRMQRHGHIGRFTGTQMGRAGVVDGELLQADPGTWVQKHLVGALETAKVTDPHEIGTMMAQLFSNKSAERMMSILLLQSARLQKDAGLIKAAEANLSSYGINAGDIKGSMSKAEIDTTIRNDPTMALQRVQSQWENFTSKNVFQEMMVPVAHGLNMVGDALQRLSNVNPEVARQFVEVGAAVVGLPSVFWAASTALRFFSAGWSGLIGMAANPWFMVIAGAGYLIWKNWDWVSGFATGAAPGMVRALDSIASGFLWVVDRGTDLLRFLGLIPKATDDATAAMHQGEAAGRRFGNILGHVLPLAAAYFAGTTVARMVAGFGSIATVARTTGLAIGGMLGPLTAIAATVDFLISSGVLQGGISLLPKDTSKAGIDEWLWGKNKDGTSARPGWLGGKATESPGTAGRTPSGRDPRHMGPSAPSDDKGGWFGGLFHRSAYTTYDNDNTSLRGGSGNDDLGAPSDMAASGAAGIMRTAVRQGVIDGFHAVLSLGATSGGGFTSASFESGGFGGGLGGGSGGGGFGGVADRHANPSIRFGRQHSGSGGGLDTGVTASAMSGDVASRAGSAMARLMSKGWSREAAAAAIGNAQQESGVRSDGPLGDTKRFGFGDDAAHGMFQWRGSRFRALKAFAGQRGTNWQDFNTQVDFFDQESRKYGSGDWRTSTDVVQANRGMKRFEGYGDDSFGTRLANARQILAGKASGGSYPAANILSGPGSAGAAGAVDTAMKLQGAGSRQAAVALGSRMTDGQWCADFVNGALSKNGIRGSGSSMALSFQKWGEAVPGGIGGVRKGDVMTEDHGRGRGHAMLATGMVIDGTGKLVPADQAKGGIRKVQAISGNYSNQVKTSLESPGEIASIRRAAGAAAATANAASGATAKAAIHAAARAQGAKASPGAGGDITVHAPISIHPHPHQNADEIGRSAAGHITSAQNDAAGLRSSTFDWTA